MNIAFSIGINLSLREFTNSSVWFNNIFGIVFGVIIVLSPIIMAIYLARKFSKIKPKKPKIRDQSDQFEGGSEEEKSQKSLATA